MTTFNEQRGAPIISYNLQWDLGNFGLQWYDLIGDITDYLETSYIVSSGISSAVYYKFKVRARNKWGWGQWSQIVSIRASTWPTVVAKPLTSIELSTGNVLLTWIAPLHRGSPIDKYVIEFQNQANLAQWVEILD